MLPKDWFLYIDNLPKYLSEDKISQSLRQQIWTINSKNNLEIKCLCCNLNFINAFTFECGHIIASSKGGKCNINNLIPICSLCNKSMSNTGMDEFMIKNNFTINLNLIKKLKNNYLYKE
jgi:5-methylcytosine-specific restriction endonuclease McrA